MCTESYCHVYRKLLPCVQKVTAMCTVSYCHVYRKLLPRVQKVTAMCTESTSLKYVSYAELLNMSCGKYVEKPA